MNELDGLNTTCGEWSLSQFILKTQGLSGYRTKW